MIRKFVVILLSFATVLSLGAAAFATEEGDAEYNENTAYSEVNSCEVDVALNVPSGFNLACYITMTNDSTGIKYRLSLLPEKHFEGIIYMPKGHYTVNNVGVYDSTTLSFMVDTAGFTLDEDGYSLIYTMKHLESIEKDETGHFVDRTAGQATSNNVVLYTTPFQGIFMGSNNKPQYEVIHEGSGGGVLTVSGYATGEYDVIIRVTAPGVISEAKYEISVDGGETWLPEGTIEPSFQRGGTGLTYEFSTTPDRDEFAVGDTFSFHCVELFEVSTSLPLSSGMLMCLGHPLLGHELTVTIIKAGEFGTAKVKVADETGNIATDTYVVDENGMVELPDNIWLYFKKADGYSIRNTFSISISTNVYTVDYTPVYMLAAGAAVLLVIGLAVLIGKKDKVSSYRINPYKWRRKEEDYQ